MTEALTRRLIEAVASRVIAAAEELTALDREIGDGDHGENLKRACESVLAQLDQIAARPLPDALRSVGAVLQAKMGGAAGPLYGTLFISLGKGLAQEPQQLASALGGAIDAVARVGKSQPGCKTMLDVLEPVRQVLEQTDIDRKDLPSRVAKVAAAAAEATKAMKATRGRAAFLADRSVGHMDPGARSAQLMVAAVCDVLQEA
jgi:phosphoenolpyruvate---glycerone phosphotransferase subunit DhaL